MKISCFKVFSLKTFMFCVEDKMKSLTLFKVLSILVSSFKKPIGKVKGLFTLYTLRQQHYIVLRWTSIDSDLEEQFEFEFKTKNAADDSQNILFSSQRQFKEEGHNNLNMLLNPRSVREHKIYLQSLEFKLRKSIKNFISWKSANAKSLCITIYKPLTSPSRARYAKLSTKLWAAFLFQWKLNYRVNFFIVSQFSFSYVFTCVFVFIFIFFNKSFSLISTSLDYVQLPRAFFLLSSHRARFSIPIIYVIAERNLFSGSIFHNLISVCTFWGKETWNADLFHLFSGTEQTLE